MAPTEFLHRSSCDRLLRSRGYTLKECIGEGAYSKVYKTEYFDSRRGVDSNGQKMQLACKLIDANVTPRDFMRRFFPRELEIMSRINYKFCLRIHSVIQRKHLYFVFMQYCVNGDLLDFIRANGSIRENQARIWFAQLLKALNYLQSKSITHRDVKCDNILLTTTYNIRLADFGFARSLMFEEKLCSTFCGSVSYTAPEIIRGRPYDPMKSDLWSSGVVLFVMLNKCLPFDDTDLKKLYDSQMKRAWKFRSKIVRFMSTDVKEFIFRLLDPDPSTRPSVSALWKHSWIQAISRSGEEVTPPPSNVSSVLDRNRLYWEERRIISLPQITHEESSEQQEVGFVQIGVVDGQVTEIRPESYQNISKSRLPLPQSLSAKTEAEIPGTSNPNRGLQR